jgi:hypothetical protein
LLDNYTESPINCDSREACVKRLPAFVLFAVMFVFCATLFAGDTLPGLKPDRFSLSGYGSFVNTRITSYKYLGSDYRPQWYTNTVLNLVMNMALGERWTGHVGIEGYIYTNTIPRNSQFFSTSDKLSVYSTIYPHQIEAIYTFGNRETLEGEVGIGYFPYKYNNQAWNFGEYLFRSGTYPGYLITNFDQAWPRLTGIRLSTTMFGKWHNDLLVTKEMDYPPFGDGTITWISDASLLDIFEIGAGVSFAHYLPVDDSLTTPHETMGGAGGGKFYNVISIDSVAHDTTWYTFKGIKTMGRIAIDPKGIFKYLGAEDLMSIFGKEDLKIYGEACILGLQNQGTIYSKLSERIPVMFGFNFPAFKLLDVLSCQLEYYGTPYPNDYQKILPMKQYYGVPLPLYDVLELPAGNGNYTMENYKHDNWKWSIYANRFFGKEKHLGIIAQAARDHWRTMTWYQLTRDYEEGLVKVKQWYWATKFVFIF